MAPFTSRMALASLVALSGSLNFALADDSEAITATSEVTKSSASRGFLQGKKSLAAKIVVACILGFIISYLIYSLIYEFYRLFFLQPATLDAKEEDLKQIRELIATAHDDFRYNPPTTPEDLIAFYQNQADAQRNLVTVLEAHKVAHADVFIGEAAKEGAAISDADIAKANAEVEAYEKQIKCVNNIINNPYYEHEITRLWRGYEFRSVAYPRVLFTGIELIPHEKARYNNILG